jgi:uncharacterized tellurite resistance protein B-like protein
MKDTIKKSVATLLAHIIKMDKRDIEKNAPLFCKLMKQDFDCDPEEAKKFLHQAIEEEYDIDEHLEVINQALCDDKLSKMRIMDQFNHIIYSGKISDKDYAEFERIKNRLFLCDDK